jgi:hypothetical protein
MAKMFKTAVLSISRVVFIAFLFYLIYEQLWHMLFANILVFFLLFLPFVIKKDHFKIPFEAEILFLLFLLFASLLGQIFPLVAQFLFGLTLGSMGFVLMLLFFRNKDSKTSFRLVIFLSFCISLALASCAEILKFFLKFFLGYQFGVGEYSFAISNLVFVIAGSIISNVCGYIYFVKLKKNILKGLVGEFKSKNPGYFISREKFIEDVKKTISQGEGESVEFKSSLRINLHTSQSDFRVENAVMKSIVSFLNSSGGCVFVGVSDRSEIIGVEIDGFESLDLFNRHLTNLIKENIGAEFLPYITFDFFKFNNKTVLRINCSKSLKPVFLKTEGKEDFYIRIGASSILLMGNKMIDYIKNKFGM